MAGLACSAVCLRADISARLADHKESKLARPRTAFLAAAILTAPFMASLYSIGAGLVVMAVALAAGSYLLVAAIAAAPVRFQRWLRLGIGVNLALAAACIALAVWLLLR